MKRNVPSAQKHGSKPVTCKSIKCDLNASSVYDKSSGEMLAEIALPSNATGAPITYMAGGKQYIAFPLGAVLQKSFCLTDHKFPGLEARRSKLMWEDHFIL
jgi:hypothetical protein